MLLWLNLELVRVLGLEKTLGEVQTDCPEAGFSDSIGMLDTFVSFCREKNWSEITLLDKNIYEYAFAIRGVSGESHLCKVQQLWTA